MKILQELFERSRHEYVPKTAIGSVYTALGDKDSAFEWLENAYEEHDAGLVYVKPSPLYDTLRSDPRFTFLLKKMGLA